MYGSPRRLGVALAALALALGLRTAHAADGTFDCLIQPSVSINLGSAVPGLLAEVLVDRGEAVTAGQTLARLESDVQTVEKRLAALLAGSSVEVEVGAARQSLMDQRRQRARTLAARGVSSQERLQDAEVEARLAALELRQAQLNRDSAKVRLELAEALLDQRAIRSPFDGVVMERSLNAGEFVYQEVAVLRLAKLDPLHVEAFLPAAMLPAVTIGKRALVLPQAPFDEAVEATVDVIDRVLDPASATFGMRLVLANPDSRMFGGLRCTLTFP
ncbi:MAG: efflux RND transporter periplasmic adaptor subunit [Alphaproteobacteria bacterium]